MIDFLHLSPYIPVIYSVQNSPQFVSVLNTTYVKLSAPLNMNP